MVLLRRIQSNPISFKLRKSIVSRLNPRESFFRKKRLEECKNELRRANYGLKYYSEKLADLVTQVEQLSNFASDPALIELTKYMSKEIPRSKSQLLQDLIISFLYGEKRGYFCEFGAADGLTLSNTYLLEKLGWNGVLVEPSKRWHEQLASNRSCKIGHECVYSESNQEIIFNEVDDGMFSSLVEFSDSDMNSEKRLHGLRYSVSSISLEDLLCKYGAPSHIDFLSIDTEGSEFAILENFNFQSFSFGAIFVEHNFTENRGKINKLLIGNGYVQIFSNLSRWDDWYLSQQQYDLLRRKCGIKELQ
jgi:FkbM family methyltransferase